MNIDLIETMAHSLSNVDVINMALAGPEMNKSLKHIIAKRRLDNFTSVLEKTLRMAHNVLIFTNQEIANLMFLAEDRWMPKVIMDNILEKLTSYMEPTFAVVYESYDDFEPHIKFRTTVDNFFVLVSFDAGISCTSCRPVYDWHGVSLSRIDIYSTAKTLLMSWSKKYDQRVDTISYTYDDTNFITKEREHRIYDTYTRFDLFKMTPPQDNHDNHSNYESDDSDYESDDSDYDSDDSGYDSDVPYDLFLALVPTKSIDQVIDVGHEYYAHASIVKKTVESVFFQPRNCIEEIIYKSADVVSKFLLRYQTWSTSKNDGYVHARHEPEWIDHSFDVFVDELKTFTEKLFGEWTCDRDYINDGDEQLWTFTRKMHDSVFVLTFCMAEGCFSWDLRIDQYSIYVNALTRQYSTSVDILFDDEDFEDDDGKQFEEKKLNVLFETIGFEKTPCRSCAKIKHFTKEEVDTILD